MSERISEPISEFLRERIAAGDFPSAVYLIAERGEIVFQDALGFAVVEPERIEANLNTIYDLASLTKPLATGLLCAKLLESGDLSLADKVSRFFSEFDTNEKREITIRNLTTHVSGLPAWKPFYLLSDSKSQILDLIAAEPLVAATNSKVIYSDLNFILLGFLIEKIHGESLAKIAAREIFAPLNVQNTRFNPPLDWRKRIAATERGNEYEKQMCADSGYDVSSCQWRDYQIWGEVHDGNCYFLGGASGHAGLFSTADETFKIAQQFIAGQTTLLKPETCRLFRTNYTEDLNEARSVAFQLAATKDSTASESLARDSFGHLGFTGTSLWIEPETTRVYILLTNRTHARRLPFANINPVRRRFHELAAHALDERANEK